jgi:uncharacterized repeat protein (TIGR01451 family)
MKRAWVRPCAALAAALFLAAGATAESGTLELHARAEKRVHVTLPDGTQTEQFVPIGKVVPGDVVAYTIEAHNVSGKSADAVVITDPIPSEMEYVSADTAGAELLFSVDGGFKFDRPENLFVTEADGTRRLASSGDYTHIRWVFASSFAPAERRSVRFLAKLE